MGRRRMGSKMGRKMWRRGRRMRSKEEWEERKTKNSRIL